MQLTRFQLITLGLSGLVALAIGLMITFLPQTFYASYGIGLAPDPNLLSELRAPGAGLATLGALMLAALFRPALTPIAVTAAFVVYLAFPAGRLISLVADGTPSNGILGALGFEILIACALLYAFARAPSQASGRLVR
jgi:hypothetical protein